MLRRILFVLALLAVPSTTLAQVGTLGGGGLSLTGGLSAGSLTPSSNGVNTGEINISASPYLANPRTSAVTSVTATVAGGTAATLSGVNGFINGEGIAIYGAGANNTVTGSAPTPTVTQVGYTGAASGATVTYTYIYEDVDAAYGGNAASAASVAVNGPAVLSEPNTANQSTTHDAGGNYNVLSGAFATGAVHRCIWRNANGAGYLLWAVTDSATFNDWSNHQTMGTDGPCGGNTPPVGATADILTTTIASGGGTTSITLAAAATQTGTFTAWPDATAGIQAAYAALPTGGKIYVPVGFYHAQTIFPTTGVYMYGSGGAPSATQLDSAIKGTAGMDLFEWKTSNGSSYGFQDLNLRGGRNIFYVQNAGANAPVITYVYLTNLKLNSADFADISTQGSVEEWYGYNVYFGPAWYGWDQDGNVYVQKTHFINSTFNGGINAIHWDVNTQSQAGDTFDRTIVQAMAQDGVWFAGAATGVIFNGYSDEGIGSDFVRNTTTATCTSTSDVVAVTSATGLAVGQDYTVYGCGANNIPLTGTICGISSLNITLEDPTCTTPRNATVTQSTARTATNAIFDNALFVSNGAQTGIQLNGAIFANSGGCCGGTQTRYQVYDGGGGVQMFTSQALNVDNAAGTTSVFAGGSTVGIIASVPVGISSLPSGYTSGGNQLASGGGSYSLLAGPPGGDMDFGIVDSTKNGSGTYGNFRFLANDGNKTSEVAIDSSGNISAKGSLKDTNGRVLVGLTGAAAASVAGGGALATGSNAFAGEVTGSAATGNVVTTGSSCPNAAIATLMDKTTAGGAKVTAVAVGTFTFSATAADVVDYIASCR